MQNENPPKTRSAHSHTYRKQLFVFLLVGLLIGGLYILYFGFFYSDNKDKPNTIYIANNEISILVADEPTERTRGLSGMVSLNDDQGMLFVFPEPRIPAFWMKDMNFPIDIIWIDNTKTIVGIEESIQPSSYPKTYSPDREISYVLEVNAGYSRNNQITVGDTVQINR